MVGLEGRRPRALGATPRLHLVRVSVSVSVRVRVRVRVGVGVGVRVRVRVSVRLEELTLTLTLTPQAPRLHRLGPVGLLELGDGVAGERAVRTVVELVVLDHRHVDQVELLVGVRARVSGEWEGWVAVVLWDDALSCSEGAQARARFSLRARVRARARARARARVRVQGRVRV